MTESEDNRKPVAVLGVGNVLYGDDGFGPRLIEALEEGPPLPPGVDLIYAGPIGLELIEYLKDYRRVIIIDAAEMGIAPGEIRVFTPDDVRSMETGAGLSLHSTDVLGTVKLAKALGETIAAIHVIAVQPEFLGVHEGLSVAVQGAIAPAMDQVRSIAC